MIYEAMTCDKFHYVYFCTETILKVASLTQKTSTLQLFPVSVFIALKGHFF